MRTLSKKVSKLFECCTFCGPFCFYREGSQVVQIPYDNFIKAIADNTPIDLSLTVRQFNSEEAEILLAVSKFFDHPFFVSYYGIPLTINPTDNLKDLEDKIMEKILFGKVKGNVVTLQSALKVCNEEYTLLIEKAGSLGLTNLCESLTASREQIDKHINEINNTLSVFEDSLNCQLGASNE
jgi:hypothetical protein